MQIVREPRQFDVMVTGNIFGDILSDCAAMASGLARHAAVGLARPGRQASAGARRFTSRCMAARPTSRARASPIRSASILSVAMMLRHDAEPARGCGSAGEGGRRRALSGGARTADIAEAGAKRLSTVQEMGDAVLSALEQGRRPRSKDDARVMAPCHQTFGC